MLGRCPLLAARVGQRMRLPTMFKPQAQPILASRTFSNYVRCTTRTLSPKTVVPMAAAVQTRIPQKRSFSMWRLRPYSHSGVNLGGTSLLAPGYSQVTMTALTVSVLPSALFIAPAVMFASALTRLFAEPKHTWTNVYHGVVQFALGFIPVPCYENLFSEMTFYAMTLFFMCTCYQLFPELMLNDFVVMHFLAMFTVSLLPVVWSFMPLMNSRAYLTMPC